MEQKECPICGGYISLHDEYEAKQCLTNLTSINKEFKFVEDAPTKYNYGKVEKIKR